MSEPIDPPLSKRAKTTARRSLLDPDGLPTPQVITAPPPQSLSTTCSSPLHTAQGIDVLSIRQPALAASTSGSSGLSAGVPSCSAFPAKEVDVMAGVAPLGVADFGDERITMPQTEGQTPLPQPNKQIPGFSLLIPKPVLTSAEKRPAIFAELLLPEIRPVRPGAGPALTISTFFAAQPRDEATSVSPPPSPPPAEPECPSSPPHPASPPASASSGSSASLPLFDGSPLTADDCMVSILTYAQTNHLSGTSTCELIRLLEILLPRPNNLPKSTTVFKKYFQDDENQLQMYFFCSNCWSSRASLQDLCTKCSAPNRKVSYYITCSIERQLKRLYARPGFSDLLQYKNNRKKENEANIEDVFDSKIYKEAQKGILSSPDNISFTWYSDGVQIYEVSTFGLWISMFTVNELPPEERHKPENVIVSGIWGGDSKPHPNIFLLPMYHDIVKVNNGVSVRPYGFQHDIVVCGFLLFGTCDVPAKSNFMNMKGHAGYHSCSKCCIKGEKSERTGKVMVFPHEEHLELRDDVNYQVCVSEGLKCKDGCMGVFGPSILYYMFSGQFIAGMTIDSMHSQFMGNMKLFLRLWFDEKYSDEPFSLREKIPMVNERLRALNLPHFVQRLPIDFDKNLCYMKASLCRNLFFFILPLVLQGILKPAYFGNFIKLVSGVALLNKSSISDADLIQADLLLNEFSEEFQNLYGLRHMCSNIHTVRHLVQCVVDTGNLFHMNCFKYEDLNGKLCALVHGTRHAVIQISNHLSLITELPLLIDSVNSESVKSYCMRSIRRSKDFTITDKICNRVYIVGKIIDMSNHSTSIQDLVLPVYGDSSSISYFHRLYKDSQLYVSSSYDRGSRVSCYCKYRCHNAVYHGNILTFLKVTTVSGFKYLAFIQRSHDVAVNIERFVEFCYTDVDLVPVSELLCVSFCISVSGKLYVVDPLNPHEME